MERTISNSLDQRHRELAGRMAAIDEERDVLERVEKALTDVDPELRGDIYAINAGSTLAGITLSVNTPREAIGLLETLEPSLWQAYEEHDGPNWHCSGAAHRASARILPVVWDHPAVRPQDLAAAYAGHSYAKVLLHPRLRTALSLGSRNGYGVKGILHIKIRNDPLALDVDTNRVKSVLRRRRNVPVGHTLEYSAVDRDIAGEVTVMWPYSAAPLGEALSSALSDRSQVCPT